MTVKLGYGTQYRLNRYARLARNVISDGRSLVYSNISGAAALIAQPLVDLLDRVVSGETPAGVDPEGRHRALLESLADADIIAPFDQDDAALLRRRMDIVRKRGELDIIANVTLDCNLACPYCFTTFSREYMDRRTADALLGFIQAQCGAGDVRKVMLTMFGGEPLLNQECAAWLAEEAAAMLKGTQIRLRLGVITNGVLLTPEVVDFYRRFDLYLIQVTIDGVKDIHDRRRRRRHGHGGSFDAILENLRRLPDDVPLGLRVNIDQENVGRFGELADCLEAAGLNKANVSIDLQRVRDHTIHTKRYRNRCIQAAEYDHMIFPLVTDLRRRGFKVAFSGIKPLRYIFCGACTEKQFVIDPTGDLFTCQAASGQQEFCVGSLHRSPPFNDRLTDWTRRSALDIPECAECDVIGFCGGGCAMEAYTRSGSFMKPDCQSFKYSRCGPLLLVDGDIPIKERIHNG